MLVIYGGTRKWCDISQFIFRSSIASVESGCHSYRQLLMPHYVTMSRASIEAVTRQQYPAWDRSGATASNGGLKRLEKGGLKYSSQPFLSSGLGADILDYPTPVPPPDQQNRVATTTSSNQSSHPSKGPPPLASRTQLERLNYRTSAVITRFNANQHKNYTSSSSSSGPPQQKLSVQEQQQQPLYVRPISEQNSRVANDDYLFPDLPPPPDALLEPPSCPGDLVQTSSLDDLQQWVSSVADMTRSAQKHGLFENSPTNFRTLPSNLSHSDKSYQSMDREIVRLAVNGVRKRPINTFRSSSSSSSTTGKGQNAAYSGAVRVDLSGADKSIRRPGSAPDLALEDGSGWSPRRQSQTPQSSIRRGGESHSPRRPGGLKHRSLERHASLDHSNSSSGGGAPRGRRHSGSGGRRKQVMFTGVSDEEAESASESITDGEESKVAAAVKNKMKMRRPQPQPQDDIWVLRNDGTEATVDGAAAKKDSVPITGVVVAQPQPCTPHYVMSGFAQQQQQQLTAATMAASQPHTPPVRAPKPLPPLRTTPTQRPANPALQRPALAAAAAANGAQVSESPDEGYHEDDGSEVL